MPDSYEDVKVYGLTIKDELNQDIFNGTYLKPDVKKALLRIADEFHEYVGIPVAFEDVLIVGSSINYHWSASSDVDLHVVYDFSKFPCPDDKDFIREFLLSKKKTFNYDHNIEVHGMEVELYAEDINDKTKSSAIYSLQNSLWIRKPEKVNVNTRRDQVRRIAFEYMKKIDALEDMPDGDEKISKCLKIKDSLMALRKKGLEEGGEYSFRNVAYKTIRNGKYLEKLYEYISEAYDQDLSYPKE